MCANAYKDGKGFQPAFHSSMALLVFACTLSLIASVVGAFAQQRDVSVTCTNPHSGVTWQIRIDYDHGTVDANPARISDSEISWRDRADGANYTLDRKSGNLTVIIASSTGGFFLHDRCKLEN
jgi:hypothetical protein